MSESSEIKRCEIFYRRHYLPLSMYALRILEDTDEARDAVQDAFMAVLRRIQEGAVIPDLRNYLYSTVRNGALRRLAMRPGQIDPEAVEEPGEEQIDTSERDAAVWKAITSLPERCREIFLMAKRDGMTHQEIAAELGISVKTVENQMTKAFRTLRGDLGHLRSSGLFLLSFL